MPDGVLVNSARTPADLGLGSAPRRSRAATLTVPATEIALEHVGRPVPNAALLGGVRRADRAGLRSTASSAHRASGSPDRSREAQRGRGAEAAYAVVAVGRSAAMRSSWRVRGRWPQTVAACRPEVICAYPITPQTHIVEALSGWCRPASLPPCEFVNVESEFAAMSVAIGASAAGARAYTATASQGLLYMVEALYNAVRARACRS